MDDQALLSALGLVLDEEAATPSASVKPRSKRKAVAEPAHVPAVPYEPSKSELRTVEARKAAVQQKTPMPAVKIDIEDGIHRVGLDHPSQSLAQVLAMQAMGTTSIDFYSGLLGSIADGTAKSGKADVGHVNFTMSVISGLQPRDEAEALLASQMAAIHLATMQAARRVANCTTVQQMDCNSNALNKLARTYAAQMTALKQYRSTGQQTVTVQHQHVNVSDGGQAIVGDVHHGGRGPPEKGGSTS